MIRFFAALLLICSCAAPAAAASPSATKPAQIALVRAVDNACEPDCPEWIFLQGEIVAASQGEFRKVLQQLKGRKVPVLLNSIGGSVESGLAIGRMIRQAGLTTSVAQTNLPPPCAANDNTCRMERRKRPLRGDFVFQGALCSSACTFALAGGVARIIHPNAHVGVHQVTYFQTYRRVYRTYRIERKRVNGRIVEVRRTLLSERVLSQSTRKMKNAPEATLENIRKHFVTMGVAPSFNELAVATSADSMRFLGNAERMLHRIATTNTGLLAGLGFDPFNRYFMSGGGTIAYSGYAAAGSFDGRSLMIEYTAEADHKKKDAPLTVRFLANQTAIPATDLFLRLNLPEGPPIESRPADTPERLTLGLPKDQLCILPDNAWLVMTIGSNRQEPKIEPLKITRRTFDMMPIRGIKTALCPPERWER